MRLDGAASLLLSLPDCPCCLLRLVGMAVAAAAASCCCRLAGRHCPAAVAISVTTAQLQSCQLVGCSSCCRVVRVLRAGAAAVVGDARPAPAAGQGLLGGAGLLAALGRLGAVPVRGLCR